MLNPKGAGSIARFQTDPVAATTEAKGRGEIHPRLPYAATNGGVSGDHPAGVAQDGDRPAGVVAAAANSISGCHQGGTAGSRAAREAP